MSEQQQQQAINLPRDEYGYISNRGRSKYYGVSYAGVGGDEVWTVSRTDPYSDGTTSITYYAKNFEMSEQEAAVVAARLHDINAARDAGTEVEFGRYVYRVTTNRRIYRFLKGNQPFIVGDNFHMPEEEETAAEQEPMSDDAVQELAKAMEAYQNVRNLISHAKLMNNVEKKLVMDVAQAISNDDLSPHVAKILKNVLSKVK